VKRDSSCTGSFPDVRVRDRAGEEFDTDRIVEAIFAALQTGRPELSVQAGARK
jgi:hypothetical protein